VLLGIALVLGAILGVNAYMRIPNLKEAYEQIRRSLEEKHRAAGYEILDWDMFQDVRGTFRSGPTFPEDIAKLDGKKVNICGYMEPIDQFRDADDFMLLRLPSYCYFCESPPMKFVMEVKVKNKAKMINEPVIIGGTLKLHKGKREPFFYTIEEASWNKPVDTKETRQVVDEQHKIHLIKGFQELRGQTPEEELFPGQAPPSASDADLTGGPTGE